MSDCAAARVATLMFLLDMIRRIDLYIKHARENKFQRNSRPCMHERNQRQEPVRAYVVSERIDKLEETQHICSIEEQRSARVIYEDQLKQTPSKPETIPPVRSALRKRKSKEKIENRKR